MNPFTQARLKLTFWYTTIILIISATLSSLYLYRTDQVISLQFERIEERFGQASRPRLFMPPGQEPLTLTEELVTARNQIVINILRINVIILIISAGASFILSGITLAPIREAMEEQKRFVADAAHELKTPITAMKTSLEVSLLDEKLGRKTRDILSDNLEEVRNLALLTQQLLTLARLDHDKQNRRERVEVKSLIQNVFKILGPTANKAKVKLEMNIKPQDMKLTGDEVSFKQLMTILIENGIKYSNPGGKVMVQAKAGRRNGVIRVTDRGIGISKEELNRVFERFYQADKSRSKNMGGGFGLGLTVARKIVALYQGSIAVKSKLGKGSTFTVKLPLG